MFPPLPTWPNSHPLIVHFPVALLLVAPVFVALGLLPRRGTGFSLAALVLLLLGTLGAVVAVMSGEAAHEGGTLPAAAESVMERHEELAELARTVFIALTAGYAGILILPRAFPEPRRAAVRSVAGVLYLLVYIGGAVLLANAAHEGGRLVHEFGVRAAGPSGSPLPAAAPAESDEDDD